MKNKRLLVIGSNSFSGSHFSCGAVLRGFEVLGISRSKKPIKSFLPNNWYFKKKINFPFFKIDLNVNDLKLEKIIQDFKPSRCNFAAQGMVAESWLSPIDWYKTNVVSQVKLHEKLRQCNSLEKYVHVSTPEVYGSNSNWIYENNSFAPSTPYAASRASCDMHLLTFLMGLNSL